MRHGLRRDIQLKGAGPTPFSRSGDGRAALGPVLREYIVSEAMAALGIPTTRALAAVMTGEPSAAKRRCLARSLPVSPPAMSVSAHSSSSRHAVMSSGPPLADHVIARHYPEAAGAANPTRPCSSR